MVKDVKKLKNEDRVYTNKELTNMVKNLLTMIEYINGALANHQGCIEGICRIQGITIEDIKKELENASNN